MSEGRSGSYTGHGRDRVFGDDLIDGHVGYEAVGDDADRYPSSSDYGQAAHHLRGEQKSLAFARTSCPSLPHARFEREPLLATIDPLGSQLGRGAKLGANDQMA
jgi:hypothetical protein